MDKKQRADFDAQLDRMPAGLDVEQIRALPEFTPEAQGASFMSMFAARGGVGLPASVAVADPAEEGGNE